MLPGDVIGFSGRGFVSDLINIATYGVPRYSLSHVGIIADWGGRLLTFESTTMDDEPCAITGKKIAGVQAHELEDRIANYEGRVYHYSLCRELKTEQSLDLTAFLYNHLDVPYDKIGAIRSGGLGFSFIESLLRPANLHSIYCSELVATAHAFVGLFHTFNVSRFNPNRLVRTEMHEGIVRRPCRLK